MSTPKLCALLFALGTILQLVLGPIDNAFLTYPWGLILSLAFVYAIVFVWVLWRKIPKVKALWEHKACVSALSSVLIITMIMGLIRQNGSVWPGFADMRNSWSFNLLYLYFTCTVGWTLLDDFSKLRTKSIALIGSTAAHLSLFVLLVVGIFGTAIKFRVAADKVHDPWWIIACISLWTMLAVGAFTVLTSRFKSASIIFGKKSPRLPFGIVALAVFALIAFIFVPSFRRSTVIPALQSPWFVPHVCAYILAYTAMAIASLFAIWKWIFKSKGDEESSIAFLDDLVRLGWGFLTMGLAMGALWAKEAWGDYWMWDPKETWALVTWFAYLLIIHLRGRKDANTSYALVLFAFLLLQMCWYGINYLPAAQGASVHLYR